MIKGEDIYLRPILKTDIELLNKWKNDEEAAALDISEIELYVTSSNEGAIQFYERENFKSERILLKKDIG